MKLRLSCIKRFVHVIIGCLIVIGCFYISDFRDKKPVMVFLGDSITWGYEGSAVEHAPMRFSTITAEASNAIEVNYGVCGSQITNSKNDGSSFNERLEDLPEYCDFLIIGGGTNDFINNVPLDQFGHALDDLIAYVCDLYPDAKIIFITPACFKTGDKGLDYENEEGMRINYPNNTGATLDEYVEVIKQTCDTYNVFVLDLYRDKKLDPVLNGDFYFDTIHPNNSGHKYIAEVLTRMIKELK